jgi:hypothetical protein
MPDGSLLAHGHNRLLEVNKASKQPQAKPGGGDSDTTGPSITLITPENGAVIGASQRFEATITDNSGVRSATLVINLPDGGSQSFSMINSSGDTWENTLQGFNTSTGWSWYVEATDAVKGRGSNTSVSEPSYFDVSTSGGGGGGGGGGGDVVTNSEWNGGGLVQTSVGRIYFQMPTDRRLRRWAGYVCSGTVATDGDNDRSVIITAAHCVYDDAYKAFARNVLFIPDQDSTVGSGTDTNCSNDPYGCWTPAFGVVDTNWTTRTFPDNIPWDYAYYVVADSGANLSGFAEANDSLETAVGSMPISFDTPASDGGSNQTSDADYTHGIGYSYSDDPNLMYCAESMTTEGADNWWLPSCGLSGGSSGGPWIQPLDSQTGAGPIISVNSWGYNGSPGMAGPRLDVTSAQCLFDDAKTGSLAIGSNADGDQGIAVNCP